jgi:hypothetical protein
MSTTAGSPGISGWKEWEKAAIIQFHGEHPREGYRRLAFMMLDADVVAVSPASVLQHTGLRRTVKTTFLCGPVQGQKGIRD